ncbi:MAG: 50S ribosomal protein L23 [Pseudomonadales bacterium]|nr:50S ribosomal protein L23 [Candidatus Woesebacteria bacterium]MCB9801707.1 50S ribosomal protein L23 [Pseudomonadales bacterium]
MHSTIIIKPVITEKTVSLAKQKNVYTFEVVKGANKYQVKEVIEKLYDVRVVGVRTIMVQAGTRKTGKRRLSSQTSVSKKALISLKKGDTIPLFDIGETEN